MDFTWRGTWQPTPIFLPREFHGQRSLVSCSPWGCWVRPDWRTKHTLDFNSLTMLWFLLLLSRLSHVRLCATPQTADHQAPPTLGFSRQEHWSGLPFPCPMHESESEVAQSCPTPSDPMDCSPPGSSVRGIVQARGLEWGALVVVSAVQHSDLVICAHASTLVWTPFPFRTPWSMFQALCSSFGLCSPQHTMGKSAVEIFVP